MKNSTTRELMINAIFVLRKIHLIWIILYSITLSQSTALWAQNQNFNLCNYAVAPNYPITINNIPGDLSGVSYNPLTNTLFMVQNGNPTIYETTLTGSYIRTITLTGLEDTEGIVHITGTRFAVTEERRGRITFIDIYANTTTIDYANADYVQLPTSAGPWGGNNGLEGVSYNPATDAIHTVKEYGPKGYYYFTKPASFPTTLTTNNTYVYCDMTTDPFNFNDLAGIHHMGLTYNQSYDVLLLSEASDALVHTDGNCFEFGRFSLSIMNQPEGVTMDSNGNIYIVGEPNQLTILTPNGGISGQPCDDGDACTINDTYNDNCECTGDPITITSCDDGDPCTINDTYNVNCDCIGDYQDSDQDGICDNNDACPYLHDDLLGTACDDGDPCTLYDTYNTNCGCAGYPITTPTSCDDGDPCTINDIYDPYNCECVGDPITITSCDDGDPCTINDTYNTNCECVGIGVTYGQSCDDGDPCTLYDAYNTNCECIGDPITTPTTCDDGDPCTINDLYNANCECEGDPITIPPCDDGSPCRITDSLALVALYNATDGPNWTNNTNWLTQGQPVNTWFGVNVNAAGCVVELDLRNNLLTGIFPPELANLSSLTGLWLPYNQLSGNIPAEMGDLQDLIILDLGWNQLTGKIPPQLGDLSNLEGLFLGWNQLSGTIPASLGNLSNLKYLWLNENQLCGGIPTQIGNLNYLEDLILFSNNLGGCYPSSLFNLCGQLNPIFNNNYHVSDGNHFLANWEDFCINQDGQCAPGLVCNTACYIDPNIAALTGTFSQFASRKFIKNFIRAEEGYIKHHKEIHRILDAKNVDTHNAKVHQNFGQIKEMATAMLFQSFMGDQAFIVEQAHVNIIDNFLMNLQQATNKEDLKNEIDNARIYLPVMEGKELKDALVAFDLADETNLEDQLSNSNVEVKLVNTAAAESFLLYSLPEKSNVSIKLYNAEGKQIQSFNKLNKKGNYQIPIDKTGLSTGIYFVHINIQSESKYLVKRLLKLPVLK